MCPQHIISGSETCHLKKKIEKKIDNSYFLINFYELEWNKNVLKLKNSHSLILFLFFSEGDMNSGSSDF